MTANEQMSEPDDPRGAPAQAGLAPVVIEKHRIALDGTERVSYYACGVTRESIREALADAEQMAGNAAGWQRLIAERDEMVERLLAENREYAEAMSLPLVLAQLEHGATTARECVEAAIEKAGKLGAHAAKAAAEAPALDALRHLAPLVEREAQSTMAGPYWKEAARLTSAALAKAGSR